MKQEMYYVGNCSYEKPKKAIDNYIKYYKYKLR